MDDDQDSSASIKLWSPYEEECFPRQAKAALAKDVWEILLKELCPCKFMADEDELRSYTIYIFINPMSILTNKPRLGTMWKTNVFWARTSVLW